MKLSIRRLKPSNGFTASSFPKKYLGNLIINQKPLFMMTYDNFFQRAHLRKKETELRRN